MIELMRKLVMTMLVGRKTTVVFFATIGVLKATVFIRSQVCQKTLRRQEFCFLDIGKQSPYFEVYMIYVQIPEKHDAKGFLLLAKSGAPVSCLPGNIYGVIPEHVKILKRERIPFRKLPAKSVRLPKPSLAA